MLVQWVLFEPKQTYFSLNSVEEHLLSTEKRIKHIVIYKIILK